MNPFRLFHPTLQTKTALYFILGLMGVTLSCLLITRYFFILAIDDLENSELQQASNQAHSVIVDLSRDIEGRSYDWAYWDETHQLLLGADINQLNWALVRLYKFMLTLWEKSVINAPSFF